MLGPGFNSPRLHTNNAGCGLAPHPACRLPLFLPTLSATDGYWLFPRGCVDPIHLDEKVLATNILIRLGAVRRDIPGAELPRALVSILVAEEIVPRVEVLVGCRFFRFVRQDVHHGVRREVVVRRALQRCAATG